MLKRLFAYTQYLLPQHFITFCAGKLATSRNLWVKNLFIKQFIRAYAVNMREALVEDPEAYPTFNDFFIRKLKLELRPLASDDTTIACPVDGSVAQLGNISKNQLLQAKNHYFDLETLLGNDTTLAQTFYDGSFATLYLAPHNYHRVHMPITGKLVKTQYVPGKLFSVNRITSDLIPGLYSRNERLICQFETAAGPMVVIMVGAMIVGSMQMVWGKDDPATQEITLAKGAELGHFKLGSTVILLFQKNAIAWSTAIKSTSLVQFGEDIGKII